MIIDNLLVLDIANTFLDIKILLSSKYSVGRSDGQPLSLSDQLMIDNIFTNADKITDQLINDITKQNKDKLVASVLLWVSKDLQ